MKGGTIVRGTCLEPNTRISVILIKNENIALTLHDKEMRIIYIQLHGMEKVCNLTSRRVPPINQILAFPSNEHLSRDIDLLILFVPDRT